MAIDIKNILELVQRKIAAVDSTTSTADLQKLLNLAKRVDGSLMRSYDSDGSLPDAGSTTERMAYITSTGVVKFNNGRWDNLTGTALSTGGGGVNALPIHGSTYGYSAGGQSAPTINTIDKFPFATGTDGADVGDLTSNRFGTSGANSDTRGYTLGSYPSGTNILYNTFASDGNATLAANFSASHGNVMDGGMTSETHGYAAGNHPGGAQTSKFLFSNEATTANIGSLTVARGYVRGVSAETDGYVVGGAPSGGNVIEKHSFATDGNATDVGDLTNPRAYGQSNTSPVAGYYSGGNMPASTGGSTNIESFPFSSETSASLTGTLSVAKYRGTGHQTSTDGFITGGMYPNTTRFDTTDKYPFASDVDTVSTPGALTVARNDASGMNY